MGIDLTGRQAIEKSLEFVTDRKNALTLGRQTICGTSDFCEALFTQTFGFETVDSIDYSSYEGASIIHNMNTPIYSERKYKFIFDGGTSEHIFNVPQVLENVIHLLDVDGVFCSVTPNNNFSGHGMYQFSQDLFQSCFTPTYGMEILGLWIAIANDESTPWIDMNVQKNTNIVRGFDTYNGVYIVCIARKVTDVRASLLEQPPCQHCYEKNLWI